MGYKLFAEVSKFFVNTTCPVCGEHTETGGVEWFLQSDTLEIFICDQCAARLLGNDREAFNKGLESNMKRFQEKLAVLQSIKDADIELPTEKERKDTVQEYVRAHEYLGRPEESEAEACRFTYPERTK
ncbi:MAG: hypothetical protein ACOC0B_02045 [bacterium]